MTLLKKRGRGKKPPITKAKKDEQKQKLKEEEKHGRLSQCNVRPCFPDFGILTVPLRVPKCKGGKREKERGKKRKEGGKKKITRNVTGQA
jgi:hypothetical protein